MCNCLLLGVCPFGVGCCLLWGSVSIVWTMGHFTDHFAIKIEMEMELFCCGSVPDNQIATKFCTWHDSCAVMACAKFCSNCFLPIWIKKYILILNRVWKFLGDQAPCPHKKSRLFHSHLAPPWRQANVQGDCPWPLKMVGIPNDHIPQCIAAYPECIANEAFPNLYLDQQIGGHFSYPTHSPPTCNPPCLGLCIGLEDKQEPSIMQGVADMFTMGVDRSRLAGQWCAVRRPLHSWHPPQIWQTLTDPCILTSWIGIQGWF